MPDVLAFDGGAFLGLALTVAVAGVGILWNKISKIQTKAETDEAIAKAKYDTEKQLRDEMSEKDQNRNIAKAQATAEEAKALAGKQ